MLRAFLAVAAIIAFAIGGYILGTIGAYRAAVVDYVENDAQTLEKVAHSMYDENVDLSNEEGDAAVEERSDSHTESAQSRAFQ